MSFDNQLDDLPRNTYILHMNIAVIGGGAAGLMTVATLLEREIDADIFLYEKNSGLGKKVMISGGGRCNVTTGLQEIRDVLKRYPRGEKFLTSATYHFPPQAVFEWFEQHSVPLKTEDDLRVFPESDNGRDIVGVFERLFEVRRNVRIHLNQSVTGIEKIENGFRLHIKSNDSVEVDRLVLTTGGQAYRHTGSTGDGYAFAESLGHTITPLAPSLNSFFTKEIWTAELSGRSFERAMITATTSDKKTHRYTGPFLFTHKGVSGPAVFAVSSMVAFENYDQVHPLSMTIDLFPDLKTNTLEEQIQKLFQKELKRSVVNVLDHLLPKMLAQHACEEIGLETTMHAAEVSKKKIAELTNWLKAIPLHVVGRGAGDEFVTAGGVSTDEVNPRTMESLLCPGLFFAGEILNIDGFTGGFNLQASWATGRLAGENVGQS